MKKIGLILLLLSGCMTAPQKSFQVDPDTDVYSVRAESIEVVPMTTHFDALPHIENQMPTSPEEAIKEWAEMHLKADSETPQKLQIVVKRAEMLKTDLPSEGLFTLNEENYTLNYKIEVQVRHQENVLQTIPVEGKGFITLKKRASLASKEKGWAWLIQKMLIHLKTKMQTDLNDVFME